MPGKGDFVSYEKARRCVRKMKLQTRAEYMAAHEDGRLPNMPKLPEATYKGAGWAGWPAFLGVDNRRRTQYSSRFLPFKQARRLARTLGLTSKEYRHLSACGRLPEGLPSNPNQTYADKGWAGWTDFLDVQPRSPFLPFKQAREIARTLGLTSSSEWIDHCQMGLIPDNLPTTPQHVYKGKGWSGWSDFLGFTPRASMPFEEARAFARSLNITSDKWWNYVAEHADELPQGFPHAPQRAYKDQWVSWVDFLGVAPKVQFLTYKEAQKLVRSLGLKTSKEYRQLPNKRELRLPSLPSSTYKNKGWIDWAKFLGK